MRGPLSNARPCRDPKSSASSGGNLPDFIVVGYKPSTTRTRAPQADRQPAVSQSRADARPVRRRITNMVMDD
jgi:hypothetical protein